MYPKLILVPLVSLKYGLAKPYCRVSRLNM